MRIGILTFSNAFNLGAALQAYSLQKTLEEMGNDAELIDYRCPAIEAMHKMRPVFQLELSVKQRIYNLLYNIVFFSRRIRFLRFRKFSKRSDKYTKASIRDTNGKYDLFVTGSDQVFNLKLTKNDTTYFLDFVEKGRKASYAASLGAYQAESKELYLNNLKSFQALSVREKSSVDLFEREFGFSADVMPDPVFLHSGEEWKKLLDIKEKKEKKYILIYALIEDNKLYEIAGKVAKECGMEIVVITKALKPLGRANHIIRNAGPKEFVKLITNAGYVVTNSFHGTAFSLIFEKQFTILLPTAAPERILDLLNMVGLENCIYGRRTDGNAIDYVKKKDNIISLKERGEQYLKKITNE